MRVHTGARAPPEIGGTASLQGKRTLCPQCCPSAGGGLAKWGAGGPASPRLGPVGARCPPGAAGRAPRELAPAVGLPSPLSPTACRGGLRHLARTKHGPSLPLDPNVVKPTTPLPARNNNGRPAASLPSHHRCPHSRWRRPRLRRVLASSQHGGRKARVDGIAGAAPRPCKMAAITMRLPVARKAVGPSAPRGSEKHLVAPGDTITTDTGYMRWGQRQRRRGGGGGRPASGSPQAVALSTGATAPTWTRRSSSPRWPAPWRG